MQVSLDIAFHNHDAPDGAEASIREYVDRLERIYGRVTACRVRVDQKNNNQSGSIPPVVHIEMSVPGHKEIVVAHEPGHLQRRFQTPDLHNAINEAFRIAERRLTKFKGKLSDHEAVQSHESAGEFRGQVAEVNAERDFGFLLTKEGGMLYFHRNSMLTGDFEKLSLGDEMSYVEAVGDTGPIATKVRAG